MFSIECNGITKSYTAKKQSVLALNDISLQVHQSEIFGLIGPDGSGKTSIIRILTSLILPDAGNAKVVNCDVVKDYEKLRTLIGYMPGRFSLYQDLTVEENLQFFASIFNTSIKENYYLIKNIYQQIEPFKKRKAGELSGGMKQKLALSCALIHNPVVLFLDEPTTGVDAVSRIEFWEMLKELKGKGITIFVSTPYMDEASLCDRIALIQSGSIMSIDEPQNVIQQYKGELWSIIAQNRYQLMMDLKSWERVHSAFSFGENIHVSFKLSEISTDQIQQYLTEKGHDRIQIVKIIPSIEDCFMQLMIRK
ncbi:MAG: ABC transporter ATP-binding protein [Saprospiraceae bacterium]|nr:ABC transporter ATP-binding protein [Saprospiraceae bacterium]